MSKSRIGATLTEEILHLKSAAALFLLLAACTAPPLPSAGARPEPAAPAPAPPPAAEPEEPPPSALFGTRWVLAAIDGARVAPQPPATLLFGERGLGGHSGCNAYGVNFRIDGRRFVTAGVGATQRGCRDPVGETERRLFAALGSPFDVVHRPGRSLTILKTGRPALLFEPAPPPPRLPQRPDEADLLGTSWLLVEADGRPIAGDQA
jgi:heat shock protein HslJ